MDSKETNTVQHLLTEYLDIWTNAETEKKSGRGRTSGNAGNVYGIQKLRELILEFAVRGKLVPQDPNDEPASELLKRIQAEKARLIAEGKLKKEKPIALISEDEKPFDLPKNWEWSRLGNIQSFTNGYAFKSPEFQNSGIGVIRIGDVGNDGSITTDSMLFFPYERMAEIPNKFIVKPGDLVISMTGNVKLAFNKSDDIFYINQRVGKIEPYLISKFYLYRYLTTIAQEKIDNASGGVIPNVSTEEINETLIPLPPLAEQHRIVAKIDELMALCDQLENQHLNAAEAHETLVSELLATLTQSQNVREFNANWQRIYAHFDLLFTTEASIDALKQTLLQLAVMGKLVPQDPNDEPASQLLKRIQAEKAKLIAEGKLKKEKPLAPIGEDERPFELPQGWEWVRVEDLMPEFQNGASSRGDSDGEPVVVLRLADIKDRSISLDEPRELLISPNMIDKYQLLEGDILIVRVNGSADIVGGFVLCEESFNGIYCDHFIRMRVSPKKMDAKFLTLVGASKLIRDRIKDMFITTAGQKTVNQSHIGSLVIPFLNVAEQRRIVAKVDELMVLCDKLKTRIQQASQQQQLIADALVAQSVH